MSLRSLCVAGAVLAVLIATGCGSKPAPTESTAPVATTPVAPVSSQNAQTRGEVRQVLLSDDVSGTLRIQWMNGTVSPTAKGGIISLDDKNSYLIDIQNAVMSTSLSDMTRLMNDRIFSYPGSPLSHIALTAQGAQLKLTGIAKKGVSIPVEIVSDVGTTPTGDIKLHVVSLKALKVPVKGLFGLFGIKVGDLVDAKGAKGVTVDGNNLILDIETLLPPPRKRGKVTKVEVSGSDLALTFGTQPFRQTTNRVCYLKFEGGTVEFGKIRMRDCDLTVSPIDKADWLDYNIDHYQLQLVAGINKITAANGLDSFVPGYAKVKAGAPAKGK